MNVIYPKTAGDNKYCNVLLPAGYDESQDYPVLYMIHGWGGSYDAHVYDGSSLQIHYGNMLNEGAGRSSTTLPSSRPRPCRAISI